MKRTNTALLIALPFVLLLAGCGQQNGPYAGKSAAWLVKHPAAYKAQASWCTQQFEAGKLKQGDTACTAAAQAHQILALRQYLAPPKSLMQPSASIPKPETFGQAMNHTQQGN